MDHRMSCSLGHLVGFPRCFSQVALHLHEGRILFGTELGQSHKARASGLGGTKLFVPLALWLSLGF